MDFNNTEIAQHAFLLLRRSSRTPVPGDAVDELELYVNEVEKMWKEQTGYLPSAYSGITFQRAARFYAAWQYMAGDPENLEPSNKLKRQYDEAALIWVRAASAEANIHFFNDKDNRRRMQDFSSPNMSGDSEVTGSTRRWDTNNIDHTQDVFSKPPVVADIATTASTAVAKAVFTPSSDASDPEGRLDVTSVVVLSGPIDGTATVAATTGIITYTSDAAFTGTDVFTASIADDEGKIQTFKVTITVS